MCELVPDDIVVGLLKDAIERTTRNTANLDAWYAVFARDGDLPKMIYFECPLGVLAPAHSWPRAILKPRRRHYRGYETAL